MWRGESLHCKYCPYHTFFLVLVFKIPTKFPVKMGEPTCTCNKFIVNIALIALTGRSCIELMNKDLYDQDKDMNLMYTCKVCNLNSK